MPIKFTDFRTIDNGLKNSKTLVRDQCFRVVYLWYELP